MGRKGGLAGQGIGRGSSVWGQPRCVGSAGAEPA